MKRNIFTKTLMLSLSMLLVFSMILSGCVPKETSKEGQEQANEEIKDESIFTPGIYEGEAAGFNGPIKVKVTVDVDKITDIEVVSHSETENIATNAITEIPNSIIEFQSVAVDSISGATGASNGIKEAVKAALLSAGASEEQITKEVIKEIVTGEKELEADVVIVGAGGSGVAAAVTAAENGAKVIVLEKAAIPGGTTANGGGFFAADSEQARKLGHEKLDTDMIFEMWMNEMDWKADANLVRQFLDLSHTTADWLEERGVIFHKMDVAVQQSHAEGTNGYHKYDDYTKTSEQLGAMLDRIVQENGAEVYFETPANELIAKDGVVTGVIAKGKDGTTYKVNADSVILASGGFVGNDEMVKEALNGVSVNASGYNTNVGDGINMALSQGAATRSMEAMVLHTFNVAGGSKIQGDYEFMDLYQATNSVAYMPIIPWLDAHGFRYANEGIVYDRALSTNALVAQGSYGWFIYNEELLNTLENEGAAAAGMKENIAMGPMPDITPLHKGWNKLTEIVGKMVDNGDVKKADDLAGLAELTGMDPEILQVTMDKYNEDARNSVDTMYGKDGELMYEMSSGPYYAFQITPNNLCTVGGARINANFQVVLDDAKNGYTPIKNLYAAGADAGGLYSDHYAHTIEGAAQSWAYNSGRLVGARATENSLGIKIDLLGKK
ncbi:FAD-dependent oxidoreductase [Sedimentibacter sp. MB31-C6]|uniref:FAD-dependent oxidoreductase n=1 Tax=Sedimentibacter sp. MB31-C6 TaxID=3109366 RepID=UPI002DDCC1AA|nr:FAD-dependent oxidoreductase [Sedimentibacter sp. MB36-C1]WSI03199.1 FAD-dependent oxidoreductase [Sedimentibacter sp. MB36-C1]